MFSYQCLTQDKHKNMTTELTMNASKCQHCVATDEFEQLPKTMTDIVKTAVAGTTTDCKNELLS